jgi:hypothetical protein
VKPADEVHALPEGVFYWEAYDPAVKTDLSCCAIRTAEGLVFVDPIPLAPPALAELLDLAGSVPLCVLVTNANHLRAAADFRERFGIPLLAHAQAAPELGATPDRLVSADELIGGSLRVLEMEGAAAGEIALYAAGRSLHFGDAMINVAPYGLTPLPKKYALNHPRLVRSLRIVAELDYHLLTFAHGTPLRGQPSHPAPTLLRDALAAF